jgi:hypothetical protein
VNDGVEAHSTLHQSASRSTTADRRIDLIRLLDDHDLRNCLNATSDFSQIHSPNNAVPFCTGQYIAKRPKTIKELQASRR